MNRNIGVVGGTLGKKVLPRLRGMNRNDLTKEEFFKGLVLPRLRGMNRNRETCKGCWCIRFTSLARYE